VAAGRLEGLVTDRLVGAYMARKFGVDIVPSGELLYQERMGIPVAPGNAALHAEIDAAVVRIRASPRYDEIMATYFDDDTETKSRSQTEWWSAASLLARGLAATIVVCVAGLGLGVLASIAIAAVLIAGGRAARPLAVAVDFVRATPFMVQLFAIYFGLPTLGVGIDAWTSAVIAIGVHSAAYLGEVIKSAYGSVPIGQHHAARALGLNRLQSLRYVLVPQMLPVLTVPTLNTVVAMIKDSAVVSVIGVYELTLQAQGLISATFKPMVFYFAAALLYFLLTYPLLLVGRKLEARFRSRGLIHA
jgi:His/Glu/Gln/Arg/opine family amino acid ABC transporter permease subunit